MILRPKYKNVHSNDDSDYDHDDGGDDKSI